MFLKVVGMFKKLMSGEFSYKEAFWKYGILGMILANIPNIISTKSLLVKLKGMGIFEYYTRYFSLRDADIFIVTAFYFVSILILLVYGFVVIVAVWRSSEKYDKSISLIYLGRFLIIMLVVICLCTNL